jgi:hypothetical protein
VPAVVKGAGAVAEVSMTVPVIELLLFMAGVALAALYGLTVSGHFPAEFRAAGLKSGLGATVLWGTIITTFAATLVTLLVGWRVLPWYAIAIGGGMMLLATPLLLRPLPDWFVNGPAGLLTFAGGAAVSATVMWVAA